MSNGDPTWWGRLIKSAGLAGVCVGLVALLLTMEVRKDPTARADAYTRTDADTRARVVDDRDAALDARLRTVEATQREVLAELRWIRETLQRIERKQDGK